VGWNQIVSGVVLIAVLVVLAGVYGWRQVRLLQRLRAGTELEADEAQWRRGQAWRRLVGSGLMFVLAGAMVVALALNRPTEQIVAEGHEAAVVWAIPWLAVLVVLMALVLLAALDLWSTRRFTVQQMRRLQDERRAAIQEEIDRRRQQRNGPA